MQGDPLQARINIEKKPHHHGDERPELGKSSELGGTSAGKRTHVSKQSKSSKGASSAVSVRTITTLTSNIEDEVRLLVKERQLKAKEKAMEKKFAEMNDYVKFTRCEKPKIQIDSERTQIE